MRMIHLDHENLRKESKNEMDWRVKKHDILPSAVDLS